MVEGAVRRIAKVREAISGFTDDLDRHGFGGQLVAGAKEGGAVPDRFLAGNIQVNNYLEGDGDAAARWNVTRPLDLGRVAVINRGCCGAGRTGHIGGAGGDRVDHGDARGRACAAIGNHNGVLNHTARAGLGDVGALFDL